jgi:hypothetical protein
MGEARIAGEYREAAEAIAQRLKRRFPPAVVGSL